MNQQDNIIEICNLSTGFLRKKGKVVQILRDVNFAVKRGEFFGVVGESGSGKSVTAKSIMRLLPDPPAKLLNGKILFNGKNMMDYSQRQMRSIRGNQISMVFQEPMTALNPVYTCGEQLIESITLHLKVSRACARHMAIELFEKVGIPSPETRIDNYPHEMSGGMRQRVVIAMALCCNPELLIADEPTTALDTTVQAQVLELMKSIQQESGMTVYYITHDLAVVAEVCDRVAVMYGGQIMEIADVREIFKHPLHPYTNGLMRAMPTMHQQRSRLYNIKGNVSDFENLPAGCPFAARCEVADAQCYEQKPPDLQVCPGHKVCCWKPAIQHEPKEMI